MNTTCEMIFQCNQCGRERQYGTAGHLRDMPDNPLPIIQCAYCKRATEHHHVRNAYRTENRERYVLNNMMLP